MNREDQYDHFLIRDATVLVRLPRGCWKRGDENDPELFDVRTGVQIREIHPPLQEIELDRGHLLPEEFANAILKSGTPITADPSADPSKVVNILDIKQRRLDSIVADSILDQIRVIKQILETFLEVANGAQPEERFWLSQQALTLVRKFSGRELTELEEILDWFRNRPTRR